MSIKGGGDMKMDYPRWVHRKSATKHRKHKRYGWERELWSCGLVLGRNFHCKNWPFLGYLTKIALTHRCGELCRDIGPHVVSFCGVNEFPPTKRPAEGFLVFSRFSTDTQRNSSECRVFGDHIKSKNLFKSGLRSGITLLAISAKYYGIAAGF